MKLKQLPIIIKAIANPITARCNRPVCDVFLGKRKMARIYRSWDLGEKSFWISFATFYEDGRFHWYDCDHQRKYNAALRAAIKFVTKLKTELIGSK